MISNLLKNNIKFAEKYQICWKIISDLLKNNIDFFMLENIKFAEK
jgi:hypothetical protein